MKLFDTYSYLPSEKDKIKLDTLVDYESYPVIYAEFEKLIEELNKKIDEKFFQNNYKYVQSVLQLVSSNTVTFNLLLTTIQLQELNNRHPNTNFIIECEESELNPYSYGKDGISLNRFSNLYALIAKNIPLKFIIKSNKNKRQNFVYDSSSKNIILRYINFKGKIFIFKILKKIKFINFTKKNVFLLKDNETFREIEPELYFSGINVISINKKLEKVFFNDCWEKEISGKYYSLVYDFISNIFGEFLESKLKINEELKKSYFKVLSEIISYKIEYLYLLKNPMRNAIKEYITEYNGKVFLSNGLFGSYGISLADAIIYNGGEIITSEHGLTAGNSKDYDSFLKTTEGRTSTAVFTFNSASKKVRDKVKFNNSEIVNIGAPENIKKIRFHKIQNVINRNKLGISLREKIVFYVSHNIMLNIPKYFPYTKNNSSIYDDEKTLLNNVLNKINKKVIYKDYPTKQYLNEDSIGVEKLKNILKIDSHEDFRYMRAVADIIVTQGSESTLGWCMATKKPIVFLDSNNYEPLRDKKVKKAFEESFFVFNYDNDNWELELKKFLNKPYSEILTLWKEKEKYRKKYDNTYFLSSNKNAAKLGSEYIVNMIEKINE